MDVWIFFSWLSYLSPYVGWETNDEMIFFVSKKYKEEIAYQFSIFIWIQLVATKPVTSCFKQEKNWNCNAKYTWILYMCFRCEYSVYTCLLIIIEVNKTRCKRPPLFIYLCKWLVDMCFHFEYSVSICLLITIDVNRSMWKRPPVFVYLCKTVYWHVLSLWILISLCLLIIIDVNTNMWMRPPIVVYLCKSVCWNVLSLWILISLCLLMTIYVHTNMWSLSFFRHRFQNWTRNRYQRHQIFPLLLRTHLTELFQYILLHQFIVKPQVLQVSINHIIHSVFHNGISYPLTNTRLLSALTSWTVFTEA